MVSDALHIELCQAFPRTLSCPHLAFSSNWKAYNSIFGTTRGPQVLRMSCHALVEPHLDLDEIFIGHVNRRCRAPHDARRARAVFSKPRGSRETLDLQPARAPACSLRTEHMYWTLAHHSRLIPHA